MEYNDLYNLETCDETEGIEYEAYIKPDELYNPEVANKYIHNGVLTMPTLPCTYNNASVHLNIIVLELCRVIKDLNIKEIDLSNIHLRTLNGKTSKYSLSIPGVNITIHGIHIIEEEVELGGLFRACICNILRMTNCTIWSASKLRNAFSVVCNELDLTGTVFHNVSDAYGIFECCDIKQFKVDTGSIRGFELDLTRAFNNCNIEDKVPLDIFYAEKIVGTKILQEARIKSLDASKAHKFSIEHKTLSSCRLDTLTVYWRDFYVLDIFFPIAVNSYRVKFFNEFDKRMYKKYANCDASDAFHENVLDLYRALSNVDYKDGSICCRCIDLRQMVYRDEYPLVLGVTLDDLNEKMRECYRFSNVRSGITGYIIDECTGIEKFKDLWERIYDVDSDEQVDNILNDLYSKLKALNIKGMQMNIAFRMKRGS